MLGWRITVSRQVAGGSEAAPARAPHGVLLATWQAGVSGLNWIDALVSGGQAISLGGSGYPSEYTARLEHVRDVLLASPPHAREIWLTAEGDVLVGQGPGRTRIDTEAIQACDGDEWVIIHAWDES